MIGVPQVKWVESTCPDHAGMQETSQKYQATKTFVLEEGKDPHPQDKIQHLDFTKDPRPLYYKTPPCVFYHKNAQGGIL